MSAPTTSPEKPWHAAYPSPRCQAPASISPTSLLHALQSGRKPGIDFLLIDLRRNDHEVRSAHALPIYLILQDTWSKISCVCPN